MSWKGYGIESITTFLDDVKKKLKLKNQATSQIQDQHFLGLWYQQQL